MLQRLLGAILMRVSALVRRAKLGQGIFATALLILVTLLGSVSTAAAGPLPAFPGAEFADLPGRESYLIGTNVVSGESFARAANGNILVSRPADLGYRLPGGANAATLRPNGQIGSVVFEAGAFELRFLDIAARAGDLTAGRVVVVAPDEWHSAPEIIEGPVPVPQSGEQNVIRLPELAVAGNEGLRLIDLASELTAESDGVRLGAPSGKLQVALSPFVTEAPVQGALDAAGGFSALLPALEVRLAGATFLTEQVGVTADGLSAAVARMQLPARLGATGDVPLPGFQLDSTGVRMSPTNVVELGDVTMGLGHRNGLPFRDVRAALVPDENVGWKLLLDGESTLAVQGDEDTTRGNMALYNNGVILAQTQDIDINLVGQFRLVADNARVEADGRLRADEAEIISPSGLGGLKVNVYNVLVRPNSNPRLVDIQIGGGGFQLPPLDFNEFKLSLGASLGKDADGYYFFQIAGGFELPNIPKPPLGCTGIEIAGRIIAKFDLTTIELSKPEAQVVYQQAVDEFHGYANKAELAGGIPGVYLEKGRLILKCKIPIPKTTFSITGFGGEISVSPRDTSFGVYLEISNDIELPFIGSLLSAEGTARIGMYPAMRYELEGAIKMFSFAKVGAQAKIEYNWVTNQPFMSGSLNITAVVFHGSASFQSWVSPSDNQYYLTVRAGVSLGFKRGSWGFLGLPWWDVNLGRAEIQGGRFRNGRWGFRGDACWWRWCAGFYVDHRNTLVINPGRDYQLATPSLVANAQRRWVAARAPGATPDQIAAVDSRFDFVGDQVRINVSQGVDLSRPTDLIFSLTHTGVPGGTTDERFLTLVGPDGTTYTPANAVNFSSVLSYTSSLTATQGLTDTTYAPNTVLELFSVPAAQGAWRAELPTTLTGYDLQVFQQPLAPEVTAPSATLAGDTVNLGFNLKTTAAVTVTTFVTPVSPGANLAADEIISNSVELSSVSLAPTNDSLPVNIPLSMKELASGGYRFNFVIDDGVNPLVTHLAPETIAVDHSASWPAAWSPGITADTGFQSADIEWGELDHPDLQEYNVYVSDTPGKANPAGLNDTAFNGVIGFTEVYTNGADTFTSFVGLSPGEPYYFAFEAVNGFDDRKLMSPEFKVLPETAPFSVTAANPTLQVVAGSSTVTTFSFASDIAPYPAGVDLYYNCSALAGRYQTFLPMLRGGGGATAPSSTRLCVDSDPIELYLLMEDDENTITPTRAGRAYEIEVVAGTTDPDTGAVITPTPPGTYRIPLEAWGGGEQRLVFLEVTVIPPPPGTKLVPPRLTGERI